MKYVPHSPDSLKEEIETIFHLKGYSPEHQIERLIPDGIAALIIELDDQERYVLDANTKEKIQACRQSWFSGLHDAYITFEVPPETELVAIRFKPGGVYPFISEEMYAYTNKVVPAVKVFGRSVKTLREDILSINESLEKLEMVEKWLLQQRQRTTHTAIKNALSSIYNAPSEQSIQALVESSGFSQKHFISLFKSQVGLSPKLLQRILKFQKVLPILQENKKLSWTRISHECGYYDQAHFIRDFKRFSGYNPSDYFEKDFDRVNFFPEE